jgi:excisionase family DNA binding protein
MAKLLTVDDVAEYLRLNREVVLRKARKGEIPAVKVGTKTYRFYKEQVDEWLRSKSTVKAQDLAYPLGSKGCKSQKQLSSVIKEITTGAKIVRKAATSNKEQQLAVLAEARKLQAEMEKKLGKPLPSSAQEIRVLREERIRRAS